MALQLVLTTAGRAALINAEKNGTTSTKVASIGFTAAAFAATEDLKSVPSQHLALSSISGGTTSSTTIHVTVNDTSRATYEVRGFGLYLENGTLLGSYSQPDLIMEKAAASDLLMSADILFSGVTVSSVTFGNANFTNPAATTEKEGIVELATRAEAIAGVDPQRAVTPDALKAAIDSRSGCAHFEASGTFVVPAGVTAIYVSGCAGGGGGGGGTRAEKSNGTGSTPRPAVAAEVQASRSSACVLRSRLGTAIPSSSVPADRLGQAQGQTVHLEPLVVRGRNGHWQPHHPGRRPGRRRRADGRQSGRRRCWRRWLSGGRRLGIYRRGFALWPRRHRWLVCVRRRRAWRSQCRRHHVSQSQGLRFWRWRRWWWWCVQRCRRWHVRQGWGHRVPRLRFH